MTDNNDTFSGLMSDLNNRVCHVAYTLNHAQPVVSTIIGDKPFFYMDEEIDILEEEEGEDNIFSLEDFYELERHLEEIYEEESAFDRFSEQFIRTPEQYFKDYCETKDSMLAASTIEKSIDDIRESLSKSRLALAYIDYASEKNIALKHSDQIKDVQYVEKTGLILVNQHLSFVDQLLLTARELRRVWQIGHVGIVNPLNYAPEEAVLINRLLDADMHTSLVRIAWELQLSGERDLWQRIENSCFEDLANTFAREAFNDFRNINNGEAAVAVFEQWFLSERCRRADSRVIQNMLSNQHAYVVQNTDQEKSISTQFIINLGLMPYGKNYLARHAHTLMNDPLFKEVRDRSNANFLWFVKFERSFREMEHELHTQSVPSAEADRASAYTKQTDRVHDHAVHDDTKLNGAQHSAIVLDFKTSQRNASADTSASVRPHKRKQRGAGRRAKQAASADIIYLRRWSGE